MLLDATLLSALSRLFSAGVFRELAGKGRSPLFAELLAQTGLLGSKRTSKETVASAFDAAFACLRKAGTRDEYVYRAALTRNILLGRHSLNTASLLTEFRVGPCKADLAILNGTSTVYEIKSDRDSLARLANQLANYQRVFAKVYVIAGDAHVDEIMGTTPEEVGVLTLARWDRIRTVRDAVERPELICPITIFESLRSNEARAILRNLDVEVPDIPNTMLWAAMRDQFGKLAPADVHQQMVCVLKQTRSLASLTPLVERLPLSLQPAALAIQVRRADHERLIEAVHTPLHEAMSWA
ncbi:sce7726 family protein [Ralstonia nicotianae]|uniref:Sce7726 family protein n=1 Tax=Ralstonia nicotianae TaxID=3037696 RepID=A0ABX7ZRM2_9RALS|nr:MULTISPECIES: sce7726 family protein [Ralstonia solanacearum species complex]MDC6285463.1 sce7726 family protein [Ralstonia pseudosolanacearum]QUP57926.1 sce7726 family protein [Ralstonia nicotianae]